MTDPAWWTYFKTVAGTEDGVTIANAADVTPSQVSRWKTGKNRPDADKVVTFARNYSKSPIEALVFCGFIRKDEITGVVEIRTTAAELTNRELLDELGIRLNRPAQQQQQVQGVAQFQPKANPPPPTVAEAEAASRREKQSDGDEAD